MEHSEQDDWMADTVDNCRRFIIDCNDIMSLVCSNTIHRSRKLNCKLALANSYGDYFCLYIK